jgi:hypothetical protein
VIETMTCVYCGRTYPWDRAHFPFSIEANCLACIVRSANRPRRRQWKAWKEDLAKFIEETLRT